jgi:hypothetical protein
VFSFDRYLLIQSLLAGDRDSRLVLADLLEEQGADSLACFARRTKDSREGDLDLALRVVAPRGAILLACDFLDHACGLNGGRQKYSSLLGQISAIRLRMHLGFDAKFCQATRMELATMQHRWRNTDDLDEAVHLLGRAMGAVSRKDEPNEELSVAVSAIARSLRQLRGRVSAVKQVKRQRHELEWQIKCTRQAVEKWLQEHCGELASGIAAPARL